ncbi:hypothetical protein [Chryseobacterium culicis]|uniref:Uncharacterized protein n=1 Tax=Chryseobacterium culicis TaxID=680127 RepID=A0A1H6H8S0_CHRCI|nr:hypothetical protein [Chryseobacterium culicis]SEH30363.1 hypothetical protein SAMN05421593_1354 [Chryseobacterium culicis]
MIHEFTQDHWTNAGDTFIMLIEKEEPGKHLIQVYKKDDDGGYIPINVGIKDTNNSVILSVNRISFEGYVVIK